MTLPGYYIVLAGTNLTIFYTFVRHLRRTDILRTRYGNSVHTDLLAVETHSEALLPPLTLQLLVENAVKHNVVLPDRLFRRCRCCNLYSGVWYGAAYTVFSAITRNYTKYRIEFCS
ncbi:hypothetical protein SAMN05216327_102544 [Dyadobacter sp. SG02]|uniref:hypothetical protein n=1 Tax=Dyadobacter sp. SG02 TaxID=1855291 RepID=UPI0008B5F28C|nr:hypothetical protein [Dyadobacter sp. SG02]SEI57601.1 hypothetical protein SAMN05216327_102544 [Dyadobacter sp. SG02]